MDLSLSMVQAKCFRSADAFTLQIRLVTHASMVDGLKNGLRNKHEELDTGVYSQTHETSQYKGHTAAEIFNNAVTGSRGREFAATDLVWLNPFSVRTKKRI
jgi:hypothetical protein